MEDKDEDDEDDGDSENSSINSDTNDKGAISSSPKASKANKRKKLFRKSRKKSQTNSPLRTPTEEDRVPPITTGTESDDEDRGNTRLSPQRRASRPTRKKLVKNKPKVLTPEQNTMLASTSELFPDMGLEGENKKTTYYENNPNDPTTASIDSTGLVSYLRMNEGDDDDDISVIETSNHKSINEKFRRVASAIIRSLDHTVYAHNDMRQKCALDGNSRWRKTNMLPLPSLRTQSSPSKLAAYDILQAPLSPAKQMLHTSSTFAPKTIGSDRTSVLSKVNLKFEEDFTNQFKSLEQNKPQLVAMANGSVSVGACLRRSSLHGTPQRYITAQSRRRSLFTPPSRNRAILKPYKTDPRPFSAISPSQNLGSMTRDVDENSLTSKYIIRTAIVNNPQKSKQNIQASASFSNLIENVTSESPRKSRLNNKIESSSSLSPTRKKDTNISKIFNIKDRTKREVVSKKVAPIDNKIASKSIKKVPSLPSVSQKTDKNKKVVSAFPPKQAKNLGSPKKVPRSKLQDNKVTASSKDTKSSVKMEKDPTEPIIKNEDDSVENDSQAPNDSEKDNIQPLKANRDNKRLPKAKNVNTKNLSSNQTNKDNSRNAKGKINEVSKVGSNKGSTKAAKNPPPPKRDSSPQKRDSSPSKRDTSPSKRDVSPSKRGPPQQKRDSSPPKRDSSPPKRDTSPSKRNSVPSKTTKAKRDTTNSKNPVLNNKLTSKDKDVASDLREDTNQSIDDIDQGNSVLKFDQEISKKDITTNLKEPNTIDEEDDLEEEMDIIINDLPKESEIITEDEKETKENLQININANSPPTVSSPGNKWKGIINRRKSSLVDLAGDGDIEAKLNKLQAGKNANLLNRRKSKSVSQMENNILEAEEGDTVQEELPDFAKSYVLSKKKQMKARARLHTVSEAGGSERFGSENPEDIYNNPNVPEAFKFEMLKAALDYDGGLSSGDKLKQLGKDRRGTRSSFGNAVQAVDPSGFDNFESGRTTRTDMSRMSNISNKHSAWNEGKRAPKNKKKSRAGPNMQMCAGPGSLKEYGEYLKAGGFVPDPVLDAELGVKKGTFALNKSQKGEGWSGFETPSEFNIESQGNAMATLDFAELSIQRQFDSINEKYGLPEDDAIITAEEKQAVNALKTLGFVPEKGEDKVDLLGGGGDSLLENAKPATKKKPKRESLVKKSSAPVKKNPRRKSNTDDLLLFDEGDDDEPANNGPNNGSAADSGYSSARKSSTSAPVSSGGSTLPPIYGDGEDQEGEEDSDDDSIMDFANDPSLKAYQDEVKEQRLLEEAMSGQNLLGMMIEDKPKFGQEVETGGGAVEGVDAIDLFLDPMSVFGSERHPALQEVLKQIEKQKEERGDELKKLKQLAKDLKAQRGNVGRLRGMV